jgi:pyruvate,water dikinase
MKIDEREFTGISACKGKVSGIVRIVVNVTDIGEFKPGEIFVGNFSQWDKEEYVPLLSTAKAIVGDEGGVTSHAAIESRKYNIPCVVGTKVATRVLNNGDLIEVDADNGIIKIIRKENEN